jgi:hypothetical protein
MPEWERRGEGEGYESCLRALPHADLCNGFFVALLERNTSATSINQHEKKRKKLKKTDR